MHWLQLLMHVSSFELQNLVKWFGKLTMISFVSTRNFKFAILCLRTGRREQEELLFNSGATSNTFMGSPMGQGSDESGTNADLPFFALGSVVAATNNFSLTNKLGEGGFGSVYKVPSSSNLLVLSTSKS